MNQTQLFIRNQSQLSVAPDATISAELAHRRLGHAGSYKGRINKDKLGCDVGTEHYDCEPCGKGKSKRIVSRDQQARATRVGQLLHVDLHPVKPKDLNSKTGKVEIEYVMIITDDWQADRENSASQLRCSCFVSNSNSISYGPHL